MRNSNEKKSGFTLIELALVLAILSLVVAGVAQVAGQTIRHKKADEIKTKMGAIEMALYDFRQRNGRLPCPADGTLAVSNQNFGQETIPAGTSGASTTACINGSTYTSGHTPSNPSQSADFYDGTSTVAGIVPVRALGLSDDDAFDPWGGAFFYAVDQRATTASAFTSYQVTDTTIGSITVNDDGGNTVVNDVVALLISYGPNGHGAYQYGGGIKSSGSTNANELINCHCDNTGAAGTFTATFIQQSAATTSTSDPTQNFDDVVRWYTRSSFLSTTDTTSD